MTYNNSRSGLNNVSEYMASGLPWCTASLATTTATKIDFPYVTSDFTVTSQADLRVGYTENGVNGTNYHLVLSGTTVNFHYRATVLYVRGEAGDAGFSLSAGLTQIPAKEFPVLSSSSVSGAFGYPGLG